MLGGSAFASVLLILFARWWGGVKYDSLAFMATIQDHSNFKIVVKSEYTKNWWSFYFEFFLKDKPVFNPEILREEVGKLEDCHSDIDLEHAPVFHW